MCAFGAVRHFGQNTGGGEDCKKNWDFSLRLLLSPGTHTPNQPSTRGLPFHIWFRGDIQPIFYIQRDSQICPILVWTQNFTWQRPPSRVCPDVEERAPSKPPSEFALAATPQAPAKGCFSRSLWVLYVGIGRYSYTYR